MCLTVNPCLFLLFCSRTNTYCGGFFINSKGYGISAYHFYEQVNNTIEDCKLIYNNKEYKLELVAKNKETHVIVVKGKGLENTNFLKFFEQSTRLGSEVVLFSVNPFHAIIFEPGYLLDVNFELSSGIQFECLRSSCRGGPGYSGGPLLNREGMVLGMQKSYSSLFDVFDSIAIPSSEIIKFLKTISKLKQNGWQF